MQETQSRTTRPILIAGIIGGLLGGALSFAASRLSKPAKPEPTPTAVALGEAREVAEQFMAEVKAGKTDDFIAHVQMGMSFMTPDEIKKFKTNYINTRLEFPGLLGPAFGEFVLLRETALSPDLVKLVYMEKYERGGVVWFFVLYRGKDSWKLSYLDWGRELQLAFVSGQ